MSTVGGSKGVSNHNYIGAGIHYGRCRIGGRVMKFKAAGTLKLGDLVYISAAETVDKSATVGNHDSWVGFVVGGAKTENQVIEDSALYNSMIAAVVNEDILIQVDGVCYCIASGAITVGLMVVPDTGTAGRIKLASDITVAAPGLGTLAATIGTLDATIDAGGTPVTSSAANGAIATVTGAPGLTGALAAPVVSGDGFGRIVGKLIDAATGAASIQRVLIRGG